MSSLLRKLIFLSLIFGWPQPKCAQQTKVVTITEPGVFTLPALFESADVVALVKVVSGDAENYETAVYKGEVIGSFKGATVGETVYYGPYVGMRLGWEYILFLHKTKKPLAPNKTVSHNFGTIPYFEVFNEGYSALETSYECVFDGKEIAQHCDNAVRVCTDYILLPKSMAVFPPKVVETTFGCRWVRKKTFVSWLETHRDLKK